MKAPITNISTGVFHSSGSQSYGHTLALVTDAATGDDPKLLFSYRNKSKHWSIGGGFNSTNFAIRENGGDGVYGQGFGDVRLAVAEGGNVGIGTETPNEKLSVNGKIRAHEIKVETAGWPDYVFEDNYALPSLKETEAYIKANKHLPEVPSAEQVAKNGVSLGAMNAILLEKIEELTLYLIEKDKAIRTLQEQTKQIDILKIQVDELKKISK